MKVFFFVLLINYHVKHIKHDNRIQVNRIQVLSDVILFFQIYFEKTYINLKPTFI